jgi:hypothetical protein
LKLKELFERFPHLPWSFKPYFTPADAGARHRPAIEVVKDRKQVTTASDPKMEAASSAAGLAAGSRAHSRPTYSVPVPINVRCYSNSDIIVRRSEVTLRANFDRSAVHNFTAYSITSSAGGEQ